MERENRYLVLKRKDIDLLPTESKLKLNNILLELSSIKQPDKDLDSGDCADIDCVVVEKDWPMYNQVWQMISDWVEFESYGPSA